MPCLYGFPAPMDLKKTGKFFWKSSEFIPLSAKSLRLVGPELALQRPCGKSRERPSKFSSDRRDTSSFEEHLKRFVSLLIAPLHPLSSALLSFENPLLA